MKVSHFILPRFNRSLIRALVGEFFATFLFMFAICGFSLATPDAGPLLGGICTAFSAVASVYTFGDLSGAHFNPAVTFGAMVGGRMPVIQGCMYWIVQLAATILVCALLQLLHPAVDVFQTLVIKPGTRGIENWRVVLMEAVLTFLLVIVVYGTVMGGAPKLADRKTRVVSRDIESDGAGIEESKGKEQAETDQILPDKKKKKHGLPITLGGEDTVVVRPTALFAGLAIGFTLGFLCFLGGNISGGAFNPARATAPALIARDLSGLWRYWVGDLSGALIAAVIFNFLMDIKTD